MVKFNQTFWEINYIFINLKDYGDGVYGVKVVAH